MFTDSQMGWAAKVAHFMQNLYKVDEARYLKATESVMPYGDMAYGQALEHWHRQGCPANATFSYDETQKPCPLLMEFRAEISAEFKLPILTVQELKDRLAIKPNIKVHKVHDWGIN